MERKYSLSEIDRMRAAVKKLNPGRGPGVTEFACSVNGYIDPDLWSKCTKCAPLQKSPRIFKAREARMSSALGFAVLMLVGAYFGERSASLVWGNHEAVERVANLRFPLFPKNVLIRDQRIDQQNTPSGGVGQQVRDSDLDWLGGNFDPNTNACGRRFTEFLSNIEPGTCAGRVRFNPFVIFDGASHTHGRLPCVLKPDFDPEFDWRRIGQLEGKGGANPGRLQIGPELRLRRSIRPTACQNAHHDGNQSNNGSCQAKSDCAYLLPFSGCSSTLRAVSSISLRLEVIGLMLIGLAFALLCVCGLLWGFHNNNWRRIALGSTLGLVGFFGLAFFYSWAFTGRPDRLLGLRWSDSEQPAGCDQIAPRSHVPFPLQETASMTLEADGVRERGSAWS